MSARVDHLHGVTSGHQIVGEFTADQARTDHRHPPGAVELLAKTGVIGQVVDRQYLRGSVALQWQAHRIGTHRQHQAAVSHRSL